MWQRIQTLYLLIASALLALMYFDPFSTAHIILFSVGLALQLLALLTYKLRALQFRLTTLAALILLGLQVWLVVAYLSAEIKPELHLSQVFPIIAAILDGLAVRGILADEFLVRSASRLRSSKRNK